MNEQQSFIQVRVDSKLKQDATDVLSDIGMDMPNAVRMFLKRIVLERGLPFDAKLPDISVTSEEADKKLTVIIPAKPCLTIPMNEYVDLLCRIPKGRIIRDDDILAHLAKEHCVDRVEIDYHPLFDNPLWEGIPYWRVVSTRGMLQDIRHRCTKEQQKKLLEQEGLVIVPCGAYNKSLKVENYKDFLFDFDTITKMEVGL